MTATPATVHIPTAGRYTIDPAHSSVTFSTRHMFGLARVRGRFALDAGTVIVGDPVTESRVEATIHAASFSTHNPMRDLHVRSRLFLDAKRHPTILFHSTGGVMHRESTWSIVGVLEVRGNSAPIELALTQLTADGASLAIHASAVVDRYVHGVTTMKGMAARTLSVEIAAHASRI